MMQNFGWAIGYNIAALPLAAAGLIDPLVAAVAMGLPACWSWPTASASPASDDRP